MLFRSIPGSVSNITGSPQGRILSETEGSTQYYVPVQCMEVAYTFVKLRQNYTHNDHGPMSIDLLDKCAFKIDSQIDIISRN